MSTQSTVVQNRSRMPASREGQRATERAGGVGGYQAEAPLTDGTAGDGLSSARNEYP